MNFICYLALTVALTRAFIRVMLLPASFVQTWPPATTAGDPFLIPEALIVVPNAALHLQTKLKVTVSTRHGRQRQPLVIHF